MKHMDISKAVVLIPAYKPDERLIDLTRELLDKGLRVMLVDDGGQETFKHIFDSCRELGAKVAIHAVNMGKGRALKTGINACMIEWPDMSGIVTADAEDPLSALIDRSCGRFVMPALHQNKTPKAL